MKRRSILTGILGFALCATTLGLVSGVAKAEDMPKIDWILVSTESTQAHHTVQDLQKFADGVAARTDGKFSIRVALEGELGFKRDAYVRALQSGQVQLASFDPGFLTAQVSHLGVFNLPLLQDGTLKQLTAIEQATRNQTIDAFKKLNAVPIGWFSFTTQEIISSVEIPDWSNLHGIKIRTWRELDSKLIEALGGVPINIAGSEVYPAMQRGVVVAANTGTPAMVDRSLQEVGKYLYRFGGAPASQYLVVNIDDFDNLPNAYKRALMLEGWALTDRAKHSVQNEDAKAVAIMEKSGVKEFQIPEEQRAAMRKAAKPIWDEWAARSPANQEALDSVKKALGLN